MKRPFAATLLAFGTVTVACGGREPPPRRPMLSELGAASRSASASSGRVTVLPPSASPIDFARIARYPEPGWNVPRQVEHVVDGKTVTFLASEDGGDELSLFSFDTATGKSEVLFRAADLGNAARGAREPRSREEELRRERQRDRNEGITKYLWAKNAKVLVLPHGGDVFVRDYAHDPSGGVRRMTKTAAPELDPKPCDSGERVAFVRSGELFSIDVATGKETALTRTVKLAGTKDDDAVTRGLSDFVAQEELDEPSGFFWSPKCDRLVYLEVDERDVAKVPILGYRGAPDLMLQRYPRAGAKNPHVRAGIVDVATQKTTWVDFHDRGRDERYMGRFEWSADGSALLLQTMTRDQKRLALVEVDPSTGSTKELVTETSPAWVSFSPLRQVDATGELLFTSTRTGHRHLELRARDGALVRTLTEGDWDVDAILGTDGKRALVRGTKDGPLERHVYAVPLREERADAVRLTRERGVHSVRVDASSSTWVDLHSASDRPPRAVVVRSGKVLGELPVPPDPDMAALGIRPVEHVTIPAHDGESLNGALLVPRTLRGRHPAVVVVYGGPEAQLVYDSWGPRLLWQHLADRGFVVLQIDNRGSGGRGRAFAQKVHKQLGRLELDDQIAGAEWLKTQSYVDGARIGIYGHSYGGFMAALAMFDGKGIFRAGVAGSPVTDWRLYDTGYTERYMETPATNAAGYDAADLARKVDGLEGKLLLTHAAMDENVHYAHTARLIDALVAAHKHFDLLVLPGERHGVRAPAARAYVPERIAAFFADNL